MEPEKEISEEVKNFIFQYIHSVEQLEILLLLSSSPATTWPVPNVQRHIQSSESSVARCLEELCSQGFLHAEKMPGLVYQFSPRSEELQKGVQALASAYRERRIKVIELIFDKSKDELRRFSDAFKMRGDKK